MAAAGVLGRTTACWVIMVTIANVAEIAEAQLIRSVLEGHGITAVIPHESTAEIAPPYLWASGGIQVQVAEADVATAKSILATTMKDAEAAIEREQDKEPRAADGGGSSK